MNLQVDGNNILAQYGARMVQGCAQNLLAWPKFKPVTTVDWHEYNGVQADLTAPVLDTRQLALNLCFGTDAGLDSFINDITGNGSVEGMYHAFKHVELNRTWTLRLVSNSAFKVNPKFRALTLNFADDIPNRTIIGVQLDHALVADQGYSMDDLNLANYGISLYKGTEGSLRKLPDVKPNLSISPNDAHGISYDYAGNAIYKMKQATMYMHIHRSTIADFMQLYWQFFRDLTAPGLRVIYCEKLQTYYYAFYNSASIKKFMFTRDGGVWCDFELSLNITDWATTSLSIMALPDLQSVSANSNLVIVNSNIGHSGLIRIADLPEAPQDHTGLFTIGENALGESVKIAITDIGGGAAEEDFDISFVGPQQTVYEFTGTPETITLTYRFFKDGQAVTPTAMSINGTPITPVSSGSTDVEINSPNHHTFTLTATVQGVTKTASVSVDMVCPMYLGFAKEDRTIDYFPTNLNKVVALSAKGIYTYSNENEDNHLTVCIPSSFSLSDVLSSGISVPLMDVETDQLVIGTTPCIYNIYRSVLPIVEGAMNFVIIP